MDIVIAVLGFTTIYLFHRMMVWRSYAKARHDMYIELRTKTDDIIGKYNALVDNYKISMHTIEEAFEMINDNMDKPDIMKVRNNMLSALQRCNARITIVK